MSRDPALTTDDPESVAASLPDAAHQKESGPEPDTSSEAAAPLTSHQLRRRRNHRLLVIACLLTAVFVFTLSWSRGVFRRDRGTEVLAIVNSALFEQQCSEVKKDELKKLHVSEFEVDDAMIPQISEFDWLETLIVDRGIVTDESMETIAKLPNLQHLRLRLSPIGDEGLKRLSTMQSLWYLNLPHAKCTAEGIGALSAIPRLRQLRLGSTELGNDVTREIATITSLRGVHLIGIAVTDEGLKTLAAMPHLESLYLDDSAVTEAGWDWLFREHPYLHVHIDQDHHDRDPKAHKHH
jgi:hypothetical protein